MMNDGDRDGNKESNSLCLLRLFELFSWDVLSVVLLSTMILIVCKNHKILYSLLYST